MHIPQVAQVLGELRAHEPKLWPSPLRQVLKGAHKLLLALSPGEIRGCRPAFGEKVRVRLHGRGRRVALLHLTAVEQLFDAVVLTHLELPRGAVVVTFTGTINFSKA